MNCIRLLKDWTLPSAMGLGTLTYLLFAFTPQLAGASRFFAPIMATMLPWFMFLVLFVTFCKVDFEKLRPVAWHLRVTVLQLLLIALLIVPFAGQHPACGSWHLSPTAAVLLEATLMCVVSPCATAAAVVTQKLGGSLEQMTTFTFLSNFLTALLVPVCFPLIEPSAHVSFLAAFLKILHEVVLVLIVPMLLAYVVKHHMKGLHRRIVGTKDLSFYLWACSLMIVTGTTVRNIVHAQASVWLLGAIAVLSLVVCVLQFVAGRRAGRSSGHAQEAGQALGQKNTVFAIWLSAAYLHPLSSVGPGCYILWQNIINSIEIWQNIKRTFGQPRTNSATTDKRRS